MAVKKLIVAIAGPLVNLLLIAIFLLIGKKYILDVEVELLIYVNMLIFIFNMLPIYPLDGGRCLKNILYILFGKIIALEVTNIVANTVAIILSLFAIYLSVMAKNVLYIFALVYIWAIVIKENKIYKMKIKMYKILNFYKSIAK